MGQDSGHIPGFEDFRRYKEGKMSFKEQHLFEKRLLGDPLLAEAYEGFELYSTSSSKYEALKNELESALNARLSKPNKKVLPLWVYSAAASLIILIGIFWIVFVQRQREAPALPQVSLSQPQVRAKAPGISEPAANAVKPDSPLTIISAAPGVATPGVATPGAATPGAAAPKSVPEKTHTSAENLADVAALDAGEERIAAGDFIEEKISVLAESAPAAAPPAASPVQSGTSAVVARRSAFAGQTPADSSSLPKPSISWEAYRQYLEKSTLQSPKSGSVKLQFTVQPDGSLSNFVTTGDDSLATRGIHLIQNGPAWQPARRRNLPIPASMELKLDFRKKN